jgi:CheY-specific phosphatase CheX
MLEQPAQISVTDREFAVVVVRVAAEVLATMFFEEAEPVGCEHDWLQTAVSAGVSFGGSHRGEFLLSVSPATARSVASGFLGLDPEEMTESQPGDVILELANILCGALLSALWPESNLSLGSPELVGAGAAPDVALHACFTLTDGMAAVWIGLSPASSQ